LVEHENGFSYPKYREIVLLCVNKIFECMESPHFQVADQALSLWKDTVMLYLSKCQKDMIWRRLFIIFKDIELNHWNKGVQNLCKEVVVYYERIDSVYWQQLKEEYEKHATQPAMNGDTRSRSNDLYATNNGNKENSRTRSNDVYDNNDNASAPSSEIVVVPSTLVPAKYREERRNELNQQTRDRASKYQSLRETAAVNKEKLPVLNPPEKELHSKDFETKPLPPNPSKESAKDKTVIDETPKESAKETTGNADDDDHKDVDPPKSNKSNDNNPSDQGDGAEDTATPLI